MRDRRVRVERALERDLLHVRREDAHDEKQVRVRRLRRHEELGRDRPGDLRLARQGRREKGHAVAQARVADAGVLPERLACEALVGRIQIELRPARARERPLALVTLEEFLPGMPHLQHDPRLPPPARVLALQEVAEELLLQRDAVVRVEVRPVLEAVHLQPLLLRGRAHEALDVAARVQALTAPVARGEERHRHLRPVRHA